MDTLLHSEYHPRFARALGDGRTMNTFLQLLKTEIANLVVTSIKADSPRVCLSLSSSLMRRASLAENERVHIWHVETGRFLELPVVSHKGDDGEVWFEGPVSRLFRIGDDFLVQAFVNLPGSEAAAHSPVRIVQDAPMRPGSGMIRLQGPLFYSASKTV